MLNNKEEGLILKQNSLKFNNSGIDFLVVFAKDINGDNWVLRMPCREDVLPSMKKEKRVLEIVKDKIIVEVPDWKIFSQKIIAYELLSGIPVGTIDPEKQKYIWELNKNNLPESFKKSLAKAIVSLHELDLEAARNADLKIEDIDSQRELMAARIDRITSEFTVNQKLIKRWQSWIDNDRFWPERSSFIHGKLHAGHILIDDNSNVTGFIDWTEADFGDPARDFVPYYLTFGAKQLDEILKYYKGYGGTVWPAMKEHIIELASTNPIDVAEFAIKSDIDEYHKMANKLLAD